MSQCTMNPPVEEVAPPTPTHEPNGRFAKGNRGGPGNPFNRQIAAFRKKMVAAVTEDDVETVTRELIAKARAGELAAIRLFYLYTIGKPQPAIDPDRLDVDEWKLCEQSSVGGESGEAVLVDGMPVKFATELAGIMEEAKIVKMKTQWADNEKELAEQQKLDAAEQAAFERGVEATMRTYREQQAAKAAGAKVEATPDYLRWEERLRRPLTLDEIQYGPAANGGNGVPTAANVEIGGGGETANGDNGRAGGRRLRKRRASA